MKPELGYVMDDGVDGDDGAGDVEESYGRRDKRVMHVTLIGGWRMGRLKVVACRF